MAALLAVALDRPRGANLGGLRVLAGVAAGPALAEQIPALIELDLERLQPGRFGVIEARVGVGPLEMVLFRDEFVDGAHDRFVVHWSSVERDLPTGASEIVLPAQGCQNRAVRIAIGSDHAGYRLKLVVVNHLNGQGQTVNDLGTHSEDPVDYPFYCAAVARHVVAGNADVGIVLGGSGQGEAMSANKVHGARAALCLDEWTARLARAHNNANVLSLGARILGDEFALAIVDLFLATPFEGGRHLARLAQVAQIEQDECGGTADPLS